MKPLNLSAWSFAAGLCLFCLSLLFFQPGAYAQKGPRTGQIGIGGQVGTPTGFTVKYYGRKDLAVTFLGSWSLERFLRFTTHVTYEYPIPDSPLRFFIGPGFEVGREGDVDASDFKVAASLTPGLNFFKQKFEVFLLGIPGITVAPERKLTIGGAVGLRYFL